MFWVAPIAALVAVLVVPSEALAWGLATHVELANTLLRDFKDLLQLVAPVVLNYREAFLYGSISPDHFLAKNLKSYADHSHNWERALDMLSDAPDGETEAFALGYLTHLAADSVAHNVFVPDQLLSCQTAARRRHAMSELSFDQYQPVSASLQVMALEQSAIRSRLDAFLGEFKGRTFLTFEFHRAITSRAQRVVNSNAARNFLGRMERRSPDALSAQMVRQYNRLSIACIVDVLKNGRDSDVMKMDPRGSGRIASARSEYRLGRLMARAAQKEYAVPHITLTGKPVAPSRSRLVSESFASMSLDDSHRSATLCFPASVAADTGPAASVRPDRSLVRKEPLVGHKSRGTKTR